MYVNWPSFFFAAIVLVATATATTTTTTTTTSSSVLNDVVTCGSTMDVNEEVLDAYASIFEKTYGNGEERESALRNVKLAVTRVRESNCGDHGSAIFGLNRFSDVHPSDFNAFYLNYESSAETKNLRAETKSSSPLLSVSDVSGSFDWRDTKGIVGKVRNQNKCGSCWAFSAVETVESAFALAGNEFRELSTEQLVSCDGTDKGCVGGDSRLAYEYIKRVGGVLSEKDYPDTSPATGHTGVCEIGDKVTNQTMTSPLVQIDEFGYAVQPCMSVTSCSGQSQYEGRLTEMLQKYGPASVCVSAQWGWQDYIGGVLNSPLCLNGVKDLDHCVQLVGYDADASPTPYWIIRNTWTANWGESGYIRIAMGSNMCGVANEAMQVTASEGRDYLPDPTAGPGPEPEYEYESACRTWLWDDHPWNTKFCTTTDLVVNMALVVVVTVLIMSIVLFLLLRLCRCCRGEHRPSSSALPNNNNEPLLLNEDEVHFVYGSD